MFSPGIFSDEIVFSLHSAYRFLPPWRSDYRYVIYCPEECTFEGLRAEVIHYHPDQLREWAGPKDFHWRIKLKTMEDVLQRYHAPAVLIDGDTYFRKSPDRLFDRLRPGSSLLHIREGRVCDLEDQEHRDLTRLLTEKEICDPMTGGRITPMNAMWNSGVFGMHPADAHLLTSILALTDRIVEEEPIYTSEQFASSYMLATQTDLRPCDDVVYHFWSKIYRRPFRSRMPQLLRRTEGMSEAERAAVLYSIRPTTPFRRKMRNSMIALMDDLGMRVDAAYPRQSG